MTDPGVDRPSRSSSALAWLTGWLLVALPLAWLDVYLLSPQEESAEYVVGRYSLLLAFVGVVALVIERLRGAPSWAGLTCALLGWLGVLLGRVVGTGTTGYPWVIAIVGGVALVAAAAIRSQRAVHVRIGAALLLATVVGLVGLA